jgi:hypothetical protein
MKPPCGQKAKHAGCQFNTIRRPERNASQTKPDGDVGELGAEVGVARGMFSYADLGHPPMILGRALAYISAYVGLRTKHRGAARFHPTIKECSMNTVRVSPVEVQVGVVVYQFLNADVADGFFEVARHGAAAALNESKCLALRCRPVDCDHELGNWQD